MLTITPRATEKLKERLVDLRQDPDLLIRLLWSSQQAGKLEMVLDEERDGDHVVSSGDGTRVLLIDPKTAAALDQMVVDYRTTDEGEGFAIAKLEPED